jgi:organic radical activating enzyme
MNSQKPMAVVDNKEILQVSEIFHSIQGEGPFAGRSAIFIRLAGCNLQCPKCDTEYPVRGTHVVGSLVAKVKELEEPLKCMPIVVITGGEPFRQNISLLVTKLHEAGFQIQIETNGTIYPKNFPFPLCTIVCSPKTKVNKKMQPRIDAFKYVASAGDIGLNGLPLTALGMPIQGETYTNQKQVYLQPLDTGNPFENQKNLEAVIESCLQHGHTLCLQLHKIIGKE